MSALPRFVLVTPARNEATYIRLTLDSVVSQTKRPVKWVIVSDGSTDGTDEIVREYELSHPWIQLLRAPDRTDRSFAGKVYAFNIGYAEVRDIPHDIVASLDADISFAPDYFEYLLEKIVCDPRLGVVGTPFEDEGQVYDYRFVNIEHVSGACQVFRRECFEEIGGYKAVKGGSIDHIAVISARLKGWKTRTFTEKRCFHHRPMGTAQTSLLSSRFKYGIKDYAIGNHPVWQIVRSIYQMGQRPFVLGGIALAAGYASACLRRIDRPVSSEFVAFHRNEQMMRLKRFFFRPRAS
jgi:poly-beta-1,6-N-acetyl-D-glucosamine synthase